MLHIIYGGSGSGKSEYAEKLVTTKYIDCNKYYIATMKVYDAEAQRKVERHRDLRSGKGFETIEQQRNLKEALKSIDKDKKNVVLLECMSNLVANEMFDGDEILNSGVVAGKVLHDFDILCENVDNIVVVTNNIFEDGADYDETTSEYLNALGMVNEKIAAAADEVVEVVVGIPLIYKAAEEASVR